MSNGVSIGFSNNLGGDVSSPRLDKNINMAPVTWDPVKRWLRGKKPFTEKLYRSYLHKFVAHASNDYGFTDAPGLLEWARREPEWIVVEEAIQEYASTLKESIKPIALSAIKTFLESNQCNRISSMKIDPYYNSYIEGYTRQQIIELLGYLHNPLQKLYVLFCKDDGFRGKTNLQLKWHHIKHDYDAGEKYVHVALEEEYYRGKKPAGLSFIGPDSISLLKKLVEAGKITRNMESCDLNRPAACKCTRIFPWHFATIRESINLAKKLAGLPETIQPTHGLRKFFENALDKCEPKLDFDKKRQIEGHSIGVRRAYTAQVESLRPLYERAYPHLSLSEDVVADQKVRVLLDQIKVLEQRQTGYGDLRLLVDQLTLNQTRMMRMLESKFGPDVKALKDALYPPAEISQAARN